MVKLELEDTEVKYIIDAIQKEANSYSFRTYRYPILKHLVTKLQLALCLSQ